jgi:TonB family protein
MAGKRAPRPGDGRRMGFTTIRFAVWIVFAFGTRTSMPHFPKTWAALAVSTLAHGAFAGVMAGHGFVSGKSRALTNVPVELSITDTPNPVEIQEEEPRVEAVRPTAKSHATASHQHSYPVSGSHDATPHDPRVLHASVRGAELEAEPETPEAAPSPEQPPLFVLGKSAALVSHGATGGSNAPGPAGPPSGSEVLGERDVSVRARLISRGPLNYPAEARRAEVEADVPVEIVVDETGRVVSARALERPGYGLDAAAVESVRANRFSAALRDGRTVRVRMRWVVQFHLH